LPERRTTRPTPQGKIARASDTRWTCARCAVTVTYTAGASVPARPEGWGEESGELHCLNCRREIVISAATAIDEPSGPAERRKVAQRAVAEFELRRDPDRRDAVIAKSIRSTRTLVTQARAALVSAGQLQA
jgi:hypothetical protein